MTEYLFSISVGPVQEFIAAARRTADLQAGSQLLQKMARYIAEQIDARGGQLIFPASKDTPGPNKVVAQIATDDPAKLAEELREATVQWLYAQWQSVQQQLSVPIDAHLAEEQVKNFLEFYTAWVPCNGDYVQEREQVELLLAGRKALRDFRQVPPRPGRWKSPLDPSRDCVLQLSGTQIPAQAEGPPLYLKRTEFLDAISIMKRVQGANQQGKKVPSTSRMAAEAILPIARRNKPHAVEELESIAENAPGALDIGDLMFPTRVQEEIETADKHLREYLQARLDIIDNLRREILSSLTPALHECPSYYAILVADGDRMGRLIRKQKTPDDHRRLSEKLAHFAQEVERIVEAHNGYLVYAGGDDLLAMLPVNTVLSCANELAKTFSQQIEGGTLSAGVSIVHRMEMLQDALQWAREAEHHAKTCRDALAVALHTRGGAPVTVVTSREKDSNMESWTRREKDSNMESWTRWIKAFRQGLTHGFPYELLYLAREAENANLSIPSVHAEAMRIFERKQHRETDAHSGTIRQWLEDELKAIKTADHLRRLTGAEPARCSPELNAIAAADHLRRFAQRLIIARFLAGYPNGEVHV